MVGVVCAALAHLYPLDPLRVKVRKHLLLRHVALYLVRQRDRPQVHGPRDALERMRAARKPYQLRRAYLRLARAVAAQRPAVVLVALVEQPLLRVRPVQPQLLLPLPPRKLVRQQLRIVQKLPRFPRLRRVPCLRRFRQHLRLNSGLWLRRRFLRHIF